jgi:protein arginine N-methyltransferase 1
MYDLSAYARMVGDRKRTGAYAEALRAVVPPGGVVVDLGAGTGVLSMLAVRAGAARVYAIEPDDAVVVGRETAAANGMADRITFIQADARRVTLPEPADVLVFDLRGSLPLFGPGLAVVADARARFLRPGGALVPRRDVLRAAPVEAPEAWAAGLEPWGDHDAGLDLTPTRRRLEHTWWRERVGPETLLAPAATLHAIDYATCDASPVVGAASWTVAREGTCHGLCVWFDAELADGIGFSCAPGEERIHGRGLFPWPRAVPVRPGDIVDAELRADPVAEDWVWTWTGRIASPTGEVRAEFRQSTLRSQVLPPERLRRLSHLYRPIVGGDALVDRQALAWMDGTVPLGEVASRLCGEFPGRFPRWEDALAYAGALAERYHA